MRTSPSRISRALLRLPIWLCRIGLGWMLANRMLYLTHTGRKSGLTRKVVEEESQRAVLEDQLTAVRYFSSIMGFESPRKERRW